MGARHRGEVEPAQVEPESFVDLVEEPERADARGDELVELLGQDAMAPLLVFGRGDDAVCDQDAEDAGRRERGQRQGIGAAPPGVNAEQRPSRSTASAMARDQGQSAAGSHSRTTSGATAAATNIKTHWACKIPRAAWRPCPWPRPARASCNQVEPISKAMPGRHGT